MLDIELCAVTAQQLKEVLGSCGIICSEHCGDYSSAVVQGRAVKMLIFPREYPVDVISYVGPYLRFNFKLTSEKGLSPNFTKRLKLREKFPLHMVKTAYLNTNSRIVSARIPHTCPIRTLVDSLNAARFVSESVDVAD